LESSQPQSSQIYSRENQLICIDESHSAALNTLYVGPIIRKSQFDNQQGFTRARYKGSSQCQNSQKLQIDEIVKEEEEEEKPRYTEISPPKPEIAPRIYKTLCRTADERLRSCSPAKQFASFKKSMKDLNFIERQDRWLQRKFDNILASKHQSPSIKKKKKDAWRLEEVSYKKLHAEKEEYKEIAKKLHYFPRSTSVNRVD